MGRTPKDLALFDGSIESIPHELDDHGGGFPCLQIEARIYDEKQLNQAIKGLEKRRKWLAWESAGKYKPSNSK